MIHCQECGDKITAKRADERAKWCSNSCATKVSYRNKSRDTRLKKAYGIDLAEYERMYEAQSGVCAICGNPETFKSRKTVRLLSVDHDHSTGLVRGLLCNNCNVGLGNFQDDIDLLRKAVEYMEGG